MEKSLTEMREERLQKLFAECQQNVITQVIGPFGLSTAMFEDRNGGNVTTAHNFMGDDASYVAEKDQNTFSKSRESYKDNKAAIGGVPEGLALKAEASGFDGYTGKPLEINTSGSNRKYVSDIDHVNSKKSIWTNKTAHLAFETGNGLKKMKSVIHSEENFVATDPGLNRSKGQDSLQDFAQNSDDGVTNAKYFGMDPELCAAAQNRADEHLHSNIDHALWNKQRTELLHTGARQAGMMGLKQSLGVLLTELVNGLFTEFRVLIKAGVAAGKNLFEEIKERLQKVIISVVKKIPNAASQGIQGGISGFMSNLITFMINNFLSTAKRFVTVIRDGLLGLVKAFRLIMFPPKGMTADQALQEGLKVLTTVIVTSVGFLLQETVATFLKSVPFLLPFADAVAGVLIGIMTGVLSAFLAYQLDGLFERYRYGYDEKLLDAITNDAKLMEKMTGDLIGSAQLSISAIARYGESVKSYEQTGTLLGEAGRAAQTTRFSLDYTLSLAQTQVTETNAMISVLDDTHSMLNDFFEKK